MNKHTARGVTGIVGVVSLTGFLFGAKAAAVVATLIAVGGVIVRDNQ